MDILLLLPDLLLLVLALLVMGLDVCVRRDRKFLLGWWTAAGLTGVLAANLWNAASFHGDTVFHLLRLDGLALGFRLLILACALLIVLLSINSEGVSRRGEYYALLLFSILGMCWMVSAVDLVMLALSLELATVPLYILAGFLKRDSRSTEAGLKYFLFGASASAAMLYGFSLVYALTGATGLQEAALALAGETIPFPLAVISLLLILAGLGFKIAAVPFHFWAPDVYEGAPTPVTTFLSTASKAAGFAVLVRILASVFPVETSAYWGFLIAGMAVLTMTVGNLIALPQKNIKRLLAYSSIAHAGYALIGLAVATPLGIASALFYILVYAVTNVAAFAVVILVAETEGTDEISGLAGLSRRSPWAAMALLIALLSLSGMPPFGGFAAKLFVFGAAIDAGAVWLAIAGILNALIGLYYYLAILKVAYLYRSESETKPFPFPLPARLTLAIACVAILLLGIFISPWFDWSWNTAVSILQV